MKDSDRFGNDAGNFNFDFLFGLMIFLLAFLFVVNSIPGIFLPYENSLVDLGSVDYRTSCILAEDPGWYTEPATNYSYFNWEQGTNAANVTRIGLAVDKRSPNVLSIEKINALRSLPYTTSRDKMGLNSTLAYNYSLRIYRLNETATTEVLRLGDSPVTTNVDALERVVLIREGEGIYVNASPPQAQAPVNALNLNKSPRLEGKVMVRLGYHPAWSQFKNNIDVYFFWDNSTDLAMREKISNYSAGYYTIYKNDIPVLNPDAEGCQAGDILDIVIDADAINRDFLGGRGLTNVQVLALNVIPADVSDVIQYYSPDNPNYMYFNSYGRLRLEVWQA